ncbi:adenosylcobinamide-GDP ribazoletransferase [Natronobiforma cellulositropha]|uniref:adenosylcobinamide-GDP ribazoletransferase n=1 Tax=Natronobiforma cellulositropha TaxID=1679076 RepID=UPI0021D59A44|nr:adenosylcobinamide-GDP ribazoletransferase [Natronobiforma cellulositropha]
MRGLARGVRGGVAFLTRLPVDHHEGDWAAFLARPVVFPLVGFGVGVLAALPFLAAGSLPAATVALGYLLAVYLLTGVHHLDGVADLGDAAAVHGDPARRRAAMTDTTTGVGALLAVSLVVAGVALGGLALAGAPLQIAIAVVVAAEVGAKLAMALLACLETATHDGMGARVLEAADPKAALTPLAVALPAAALAWPHPAAAVALGGALCGACLPWAWARRNLEGVSGDVFGAVNEVGRVAGLHAGVIAWTLW